MNEQATPDLELDEIQGNILAGFNKDFASFLFFAFPPDQIKIRDWLRTIEPQVATTTEVRAFNTLFKQLRARHPRGQRVVEATWMNLALTFRGFEAIGLPPDDVTQLPAAFREGMRTRAAAIGDTGNSSLDNWPAGLGSSDIHALMIVAADSADDRNRQVAHFVRQAARYDVTLVFEQQGMTRRDAPGHEHFGFKDGISQPGVLGFDEADPDAPRKRKGQPGTDLIAPGEFVLGYAKQPPAQPNEPTYDPARPADDPANLRPAWLRNGSFLVFRRLTQDVSAFQAFIRDTSTHEQMSEDLFGAKLVGRYRSGAPLEGAQNSQADPGIATPSRAEDAENNDFEYSTDADGAQVPRGAHIRKAYPRDQDPPGEPEAERRRIMRRGIPFGHSFHRGAHVDTDYGPTPHFPHERGLCFVCYQSSIEDQFEFIQRKWVNEETFPQAEDGVDPVISQAGDERAYSIPGAPLTPVRLSRWVTTTGGEYFFAPSISALQEFGRTR